MGVNFKTNEQVLCILSSANTNVAQNVIKYSRVIIDAAEMYFKVLLCDC